MGLIELTLILLHYNRAVGKDIIRAKLWVFFDLAEMRQNFLTSSQRATGEFQPISESLAGKEINDAAMSNESDKPAKRC